MADLIIHTSYFCIKKMVFKPQSAFFSDKELYSIAFLKDGGKICYAGKNTLLDKSAIILSDPTSPYVWEAGSGVNGFCYVLLFDAKFLGDDGASSFSALLKREPVLLLSSDNKAFFESIFQKMDDVFQTLDVHGQILLKNYMAVVLYELGKLPVLSDISCYQSAAQRITELFFNILDSQFPAEGELQKCILTTPSQYADKLCVHVNYLNRVIKKVTGKTTSEILAERVVEEAKRLLRTTNLSIGEIGDMLGFEEIASFSKFFRKRTGYCPKFFRLGCKQEMVA